MRGTSGVLVFALVVMGFMAFGYSRKESMETAQDRLRSRKTAWRNPQRPPTNLKNIGLAGVRKRL